MPTPSVTPIIRQVSRPYLTLDEYKNAPTALDYGNLVQGGTQAAQDAELTNAITRASSYIDQYCNQVLAATLDIEQQRVRMRPDGTIRIHPKYFPIVSLNSLSFGFFPSQTTTVQDLSAAWIEEQQIIFPISGVNLNWSSQGSLGFGFPSTPRAETYVTYSYVNGWNVSALAVASNAGATTLILDNGTGITAGQTLKIYDGATSENVTVADTYSYGSSTVPLTSATLYAHTIGDAVSAMPAAVKQAAILVTSAYLKIRGDASMVLDVTNIPGVQLEGSQRVGGDIAHAQDILKPFRRIR
jgi:hypothetical protein